MLLTVLGLTNQGQWGPAALILGFIIAAFTLPEPRPTRPSSLREPWQTVYLETYAELCQTSLPLFVLDDETWTAFFVDSIPGIARPLIQPPRDFEDRLYFASACWATLRRYAAGDRSDLGLQLIDAWPLIQRLRGGWGSINVPPDILSVARFAAIYDFFHGPQAEFAAPSEAGLL
jgi:hypothetical protein